MLTNSRRGARAALPAVLAAGLGLAVAGPAFAQAPSECQSVGPMMQERAKLLQQVDGFKRKKPTPTQACSIFSTLVANGSKLIPWIDTNGAWCHVPPDFGTNIKAQHAQITKVRGQACGVAAKEKQMIEQARRAQQQQRGPGGAPTAGPIGGGDEIIGGSIRMPQGAL